MKYFVIVGFVFFLSACSSLIERTAKYSDLALSEECTREKVIKRIGTPVLTEKEDSMGGTNVVDTFIVKGRVFDSGNYWAANAGWVMTLGISEFVLFPWACWNVASQAIHPTEKKLKVRYINNSCVYFSVVEKP